jgi:hypothetical protein
VSSRPWVTTALALSCACRHATQLGNDAALGASVAVASTSTTVITTAPALAPAPASAPALAPAPASAPASAPATAQASASALAPALASAPASASALASPRIYASIPISRYTCPSVARGGLFRYFLASADTSMAFVDGDDWLALVNRSPLGALPPEYAPTDLVDLRDGSPRKPSECEGQRECLRRSAAPNVRRDER